MKFSLVAYCFTDESMENILEMAGAIGLDAIDVPGSELLDVKKISDID